MNFAEIIQNNYSSLNTSIKWWAKYAFHYTDILNAVSILQTGKLYSRLVAEKHNLMKNDNASYQVIDVTTSNTQSYARFYFRPLTPTQYYNEGYKHPAIRYDNDINANVPVPVFFAFNLDRFLSDTKVEFSPFSQAGSGAQKFSGVDNFSKLPFDKIYSSGYADDDLRKYRHAELLYPECYNIDDSLEAILCRNEFEQSMLLSLLRNSDSKLYFKYKNYIRICRDNMFEKNGLFLKNIRMFNNRILFDFADTNEKHKYENSQMQKNNLSKLPPIKMNLLFEWSKSKQFLKRLSLVVDIDYLQQRNLAIYLPIVNNATALSVTVSFFNELIGFKKFILNEMV